jgi:hypothetical protein
MDDVDYFSLDKDLGTHTRKHNFADRALGTWSAIRPMELNMMEELEGFLPGIWDNPIDPTANDDGDGDFSDIPIKCDSVIDEEEFASVDENDSETYDHGTDPGDVEYKSLFVGSGFDDFQLDGAGFDMVAAFAVREKQSARLQGSPFLKAFEPDGCRNFMRRFCFWI